MGNRSTWRWAVTLSALVLTTACGGQAKPEATSPRPAPTAGTMTSAPSPATSTTPAIDPNIPTAARAHTPAGAEAFTRYFFAQINRAWRDPAPGALSPLSKPSCGTCRGIDAEAVAMKTKAQRYASDPFTLSQVGAIGVVDKQQKVLVLGTQNAAAVVNASGSVVRRIPSGKPRFTATLIWTNSGWMMAKLQVLQ